LIAVPHDEADSGKLHQDVNQRARMMAHEKMQSDPQLAKKVMKMLAE
jgi:hypothetical protein